MRRAAFTSAWISRTQPLNSFHVCIPLKGLIFLIQEVQRVKGGEHFFPDPPANCSNDYYCVFFFFFQQDVPWHLTRYIAPHGLSHIVMSITMYQNNVHSSVVSAKLVESNLFLYSDGQLLIVELRDLHFNHIVSWSKHAKRIAMSCCNSFVIKLPLNI